MKRAISIWGLFVCCVLWSSAQTLTAPEVVDKMNEACQLMRENKAEEALAAFLVVGKNTEAQRTEPERQTYVLSQTMACARYRILKRYEEGYLLAKKLLQGSLTDKEKKNVGYEYAYNGRMYVSTFMIKGEKQYARARGLLEELAPYADDKVGKYIQADIALTWFYEGAQKYLAYQFVEAARDFDMARKRYHELGKRKEEMSAWKWLAGAKDALDDIDGAEQAYRQALALAQAIDKSDAQMEILGCLRKLAKAKGDDRLVQAYEASCDSLVERSSDVCVKCEYCLQKGGDAEKLGQYGLAEQWLLRAKELAENDESRGVGAFRYRGYSALSKLYRDAGRYADALAYAQKALEAYQTTIPATDAHYNSLYVEIAHVYREMGKRALCYASLDKAFEAIDRMVEPREKATLYTARGLCHKAFGDYREALADYKKADEMLASKYPQTDGERMRVLALKGGVEAQLGEYAEAEQSYRVYFKCAKALYGEQSLESVNAQINFANAEGFAGHVDKGCDDYSESIRLLRDVMKRRIPSMALSDREGFWEPLSSLFTQMTPFALKAGKCQTPFTQVCYDALVMSKSFLLESERSMYDVIRREGTDEDMRHYMQLTAMHRKLKEWEKNYGVHADSIMSLSRGAGQIERLLASRCRGYSNGTDFMDVDYTAVKQALKPGEVLIDFTDFVSHTQGRKYAAYVVDKEQTYPLLVPLFAERQIDSLGIVRPDMYYKADYVEEVLKMLWQPVVGKVAEGATVYYVPSQLLFRVALESLPLSDGTLLGDHYHFVRLSSARQLVKMQRQGSVPSAHTAVLYGGLRYDLEPTAMEREAKRYDVSGVLAMRGDVVRGDSVFHELEESGKEVEQIAAILEKEHWQVTLYTAEKGTEESFLAMHGQSPQVLQLATHGFYYTPGDAEEVRYLKGYTDAMSLSGLVMSGGNRAWLGKTLPEGVLGGILTANDIARLDLSHTDMVVLSACKSGQGKATAEGLYGLQRAFKKAGVETIVMSLWNVSDKTASEFMVTFYERLADKNNHWNKRKAFEEAKNIIRKKYPEPYHWAAFVMLD